MMKNLFTFLFFIAVFVYTGIGTANAEVSESIAIKYNTLQIANAKAMLHLFRRTALYPEAPKTRAAFPNCGFNAVSTIFRPDLAVIVTISTFCGYDAMGMERAALDSLIKEWSDNPYFTISSVPAPIAPPPPHGAPTRRHLFWFEMDKVHGADEMLTMLAQFYAAVEWPGLSAQFPYCSFRMRMTSIYALMEGAAGYGLVACKDVFMGPAAVAAFGQKLAEDERFILSDDFPVCINGC